MSIPDRGGFYWACWRIPSDELEGGPYDYTPGPWEVVELIIYDGEWPRVEMMAIPGQQHAENFHWGQRLEPPAQAVADVEVRDGIDRRAVKRYAAMTSAQRVEDWESGWRKK